MSGDRVVTLRAVCSAPAADPDLVDVVSRLLERVIAGEIVGVVFTAEVANGKDVYSYCNVKDCVQMLGHLHLQMGIVTNSFLDVD